MQLTSSDFQEGDTLDMVHVGKSEHGFGCGGGDESPQLAWSGAPEGTKSFAVTCYDPDAPTGSGFWHWQVINLPAEVTELPRNAGSADGSKLPAGAVQIRNDYGVKGYGGPCPPEGHGPHHYIFTVFAVTEEKLPLNADTSCAVTGFMLNHNNAGTAKLTGLFER